MAEVASAFVTLMPSARGFGSATEKQVGGELDKSGKKVGARFGTALKAGALAVTGGAVLAVGFLKGAFGEAREAQKVGALTNSVIKATGGAAGITAKQVGDMAGRLSQLTGIDDETIQSGENMLLTFKNLRNEVGGKFTGTFDTATQTLVDMSAALGTEPKQAAIQLGKALNDPVKGITALSRVGVTFTEGQKKQIAQMVKHNDVTSAQAIILKELNSEFGGAAEAQATAGDKAKVAWGNFQEAVGTALLPLLDKLLTGLTGLANFASDNVGPAFEKIGDFIAPIQEAVGGFFDSLSGGGKASGLLGQLSKTGKSLIQMGRALAPILADLARQFVSFLGPAVKSIGDLIETQLLPSFRAILPILTPVAGFILRILGGAVIGALKGAVQALGGFIQIISGVFRLVTALVHGDWSQAWKALKQIASGVMDAVVGLIKVWWNLGILAIFKRAALFLTRDLWVGMWSALKSTGTKALAGIKDMVSAGFREIVSVIASIPGRIIGLGSKFAAAGRSIIGKLIDGLKNAGQFVSDIAGSVWNAVKGMLNAAIGKINAALSFKISLPGPDISYTSHIPYLAKGGPATAGQPYIVGENGPELFVPSRSGVVVPNERLSENTPSQQEAPSSGMFDFRGSQIVAHDYHDFMRQMQRRRQTAALGGRR